MIRSDGWSRHDIWQHSSTVRTLTGKRRCLGEVC